MTTTKPLKGKRLLARLDAMPFGETVEINGHKVERVVAGWRVDGGRPLCTEAAMALLEKAA